jgi:hypothetical protein
MKTFLTIIFATICAAIANGQTIKTLGYNTTSGQIIYSGTNDLSFTNIEFFVRFREISAENIEAGIGTNAVSFGATGIDFAGVAAAATRTNLELGATWLTNTNVTNFRSAIGLGAGNNVFFDTVSATEFSTDNGISGASLSADGILFSGNSAAATRTNLGLGGGITTNRTFVSYNGTNYTTNSVSISNGVITGWTQ